MWQIYVQIDTFFLKIIIEVLGGGSWCDLFDCNLTIYSISYLKFNFTESIYILLFLNSVNDFFYLVIKLQMFKKP